MYTYIVYIVHICMYTMNEPYLRQSSLTERKRDVEKNKIYFRLQRFSEFCTAAVVLLLGTT